MIIPKTREEIELMRESALIVSKTLGEIAKVIKPGVTTLYLDKIAEGEANKTILEKIQRGQVHYVVNTLSRGKKPENDGFRIRRTSVENGVPCFTSLDTAEAVLKVIESMTFKMEVM